MPRKHRPRTTTLYLPPPEQVEPAAPPSLEVLLAAQQIAHDRGHAFDIESFLLPAQREEYLAYLESESERSSEKRGTGEAETPTEDEPAPKRPRPLSAGPAASHWRSRLLTGRRTRSATPRIKSDPDANLGSMPGTPTNHSLRDREKSKQEIVLPADRPEIQASASYWNHLLVQAREARGPQWDYNTQMLMFDQHSDKYYSQGLPAPPTPPRPPPKKLEEVPNGEPNGEGKGKAPEIAPARQQPPPPPPSGMLPRFSNAAGGSGGSASGSVSGSVSGPSPSAGPAQSPQNPSQSPSQNQLPPHLRMQAAAQANVQAQALALGQSGGFNLNPMVMQGRPGINPMSLMGGMGGMQMGQMGQFQGGPQGQGPMVGGGWGGEQFQQNG
ncbi:hypothetical protein CC85DRAFT_326319 [Cutaneotrichosporon oleaginosum]|uniref:Uncharacterized protein n=1 Tax=Cutaneotrichosporon oleaginosum TaxID=879819 RepID=A0A0J1BA42_9TREE|nr:uncharacterized protein CC85DRAFT_326319 [Cutaneotrichosporon oleaginosum]KLT44759.1 hypothetical protein CC85DRAFT_326319 [Cutaneotrichosporon oleaginosum]TXT07745.1 hypothetical protein COLE_04669 [Cutaneotrichosporon oleaginosum]